MLRKGRKIQEETRKCKSSKLKKLSLKKAHFKEGIDLPLTKFDDSSRARFDVDRDKCSSPVSRLRWMSWKRKDN